MRVCLSLEMASVISYSPSSSRIVEQQEQKEQKVQYSESHINNSLSLPCIYCTVSKIYQHFLGSRNLHTSSREPSSHNPSNKEHSFQHGGSITVQSIQIASFLVPDAKCLSSHPTLNPTYTWVNNSLPLARLIEDKHLASEPSPWERNIDVGILSSLPSIVDACQLEVLGIVPVCIRKSDCLSCPNWQIHLRELLFESEKNTQAWFSS